MRNQDLCWNPVNCLSCREMVGMLDKLAFSNRQRVAPRKPRQLTVVHRSRVTNSPESSSLANATLRMAQSRRRSRTHLWPLTEETVSLGHRQRVGPAVLLRPPSNHRISSWGRHKILQRWFRAMATAWRPRAPLGSMQPISLTLLF